MATTDLNKKFDIVCNGNIYGFFPSINTYQGNKGKLDECWSALLKDFRLLPDNKITFSFNWDDYNYTVVLKQVNDTNYQGRAISNGDEAAKVYYTLYSNSKGYSLIGTWNEDEFTYDSMIEVRI